MQRDATRCELYGGWKMADGSAGTGRIYAQNTGSMLLVPVGRNRRT